MIQIAAWSAYGWLRHGFSERRGGCSTVYGTGVNGEEGDLNLGLTAADDPALVRENRVRAVLAVAGDEAVRLVTVRQVHGTAVRLVRGGVEEVGTRAILDADGMMTAVPGLLLGIQAADCVPVLVADVRLRVVAAFHAGWRGTVAGIVEHGIAGMRAEFGSDPGDLVAAVGPAIGVCCYTVGEEVETRFGEAFPYAEELFRRGLDGTYLDLAEANRRQLLGAGLGAERIVLTGACTACTWLAGRRRFFSHRAESGHTGRAMGLIGVAPGG